MSAVEQRSPAAHESALAVEELHARLLTSYMLALDEASQPKPRRFDPPPRTRRKGDRRRQYTTRKLVESHVKRRLELLASIYTQHALAGPAREPYERLAADASAFAATLSFWRLATWLAVLPIAIALAGPVGSALTGVSFDGWTVNSTGDVVWLLIYAAFLVYYLGSLLPNAFHRKRSCLLSESDGRNTYRCEAELFEALGRGRPTERSLDLILGAAVAVPLFVFGPIVGVLVGLLIWDDAKDVPVLFILAGYVPGGIVTALLWLAWRDRRWR